MDTAVYGSYLIDDEALLQSASGGVAAALAEQTIKEGGYVAGVVWSDDFRRAHYALFHSLDDLPKLRGSKYIEAECGSIYSDVKRLIDDGQSVLFIGLPCTVAAVKQFVGRDDGGLLTCELICHGPTSAKVHEEYVERLEKRYRSRIKAFSVRYKEKGWTPPYLRAEFENGQVFMKPFYETEYGMAFAVMARESCYRCPFKGENRRGDIMIGDFWGASESDPFWNRNGVSVIFVRTEKGARRLQTLSGIRLFESDFETAVRCNPRVISPRPRAKNDARFRAAFASKGLFRACAPLKMRKRIVKLIPRRWISPLKRLLRMK